MSTPVISTDVGGQTELIDNSVGGVVHCHLNPTEKEYQEEIDEYVKESLRVLDNLEEITKNCRKKVVNNFTLNIMMSKFDKIFEKTINDEKKKESSPLDKTVYELACESFATLYFNYTNDYYEKNFGIFLTAKKTKHEKLYRHAKAKLEVIGAVKEGKVIVEYLRSLKRLGLEFVNNIKLFFKAIFAGIVILLKIIKRIITKPFRKS